MSFSYINVQKSPNPPSLPGFVPPPPPPLPVKSPGYVSAANSVNRAVYTGIKIPKFFSHSSFSLEVARQLPLNTAKNPPLKCGFFETPPVFHYFFANVNARSPLAGIIQVFDHVERDLPRNHPRPAMYCALRKVKGREKSRMRTSYQKKKNSMRFGGFRACAFVAKKKKSYGFFWQCKRYNKTQVFWILVFANVNGPIVLFITWTLFVTINVLLCEATGKQLFCV